MKYQFVDGKNNPVFDEQDLIAEMTALGYEKIGENHNTYNRAELQGQPIFKGLCGPMWNGENNIRYETPEMNDLLSR